MKNLIFVSIMIFAIFQGCTKEDTTPSDLTSQINALPKVSLDEDELMYLLLMREEEKLAMDVYTTLYDKWKVNVFLNISSSEQEHTNAVLTLLNKYNLPDPVSNNAVGIFIDEHLQSLYTQLVTLGNNSVLDAYKTGATIEDLDIFDLNDAILKTDNQDISLVYENLSMGSRNHMRSFYGQITSLGGTYTDTAQYISQLQLDAIINSPRENNKP